MTKQDILLLSKARKILSALHWESKSSILINILDNIDEALDNELDNELRGE